MAKNKVLHQDKPLYNILQDIGRHHFINEVFDDFLDYCIACLLVDGCQKTAERLKSKYKEKYNRFIEAYKQLVSEYQKIDWGHTFVDPLGSLYETITSSYKSSAMGQFFTPEPVCTFMAHILGPIDKEKWSQEEGKTINDPACGSGRTVLAYHVISPFNYLFCEDLDPMCTKMATINMAWHFARGQTVNCNSLMIDDFRFGYAINPYMEITRINEDTIDREKPFHVSGFFIPHIVKIEEHQCYTLNMWRRKVAEKLKEQHAPVPVKPKPVPAEEIQKVKEHLSEQAKNTKNLRRPGEQLSIF